MRCGQVATFAYDLMEEEEEEDEVLVTDNEDDDEDDEFSEVDGATLEDEEVTLLVPA